MNINDKTEETKLLRQFVTFIIDNEFYGVEVLKVQDIIGMTKITFMPNTIPCMKGVINLRGIIIPVIDMRIKLNMSEREYDKFTVIIIVEVKGKLIGMIVDSVADVSDIPIDSIQDTPHFTSKIETDYISGIGNVDEKLIIILDVDKILSNNELDVVSKDAVK